MEALYEHITINAVRLAVMTENVYFKNSIFPRQKAVTFVLEVIEAMLKNKLKEIRTDVIKTGKTYYVEIAGGREFERQPLVPFKGFYKSLTAQGIHTGGNPYAISLGDIYAIASESKTTSGNQKKVTT
jgi:hypothetical protein